MSRLPRHAWLLLLLIFLCGADYYCLAQTGGRRRPVVENDEGAWKEFSPAGVGFTVSMPAAPAFMVQNEDVRGLKIPHNIYTLSTNTFVYLVTYADFPFASDDPAVARRALDAGRDNALAQYPSSKLLSEKDIALDGNSGREWLISDGEFVFTARAYYVKGRLYQLLVGTGPNQAFKNGQPSADPLDRTELYERVSTRFLGSFKLAAMQAALGEVDSYLAREKLYRKGEGASAGVLFDAGILEGRARNLPQPAYPPIARAARAIGNVTVKVVVDESGKVVAAQAISGHPLLQQAAVKAAREAQFAPTLLEGKAVKVVGTVTYNFVEQ